MSKNPSDLIPVREARALVGISDYKMTALIKAGIVATHLNPPDRRVKYVSRDIFTLSNPGGLACARHSELFFQDKEGDKVSRCKKRDKVSDPPAKYYPPRESVYSK
jgi:hypothetical protein